MSSAKPLPAPVTIAPCSSTLFPYSSFKNCSTVLIERSKQDIIMVNYLTRFLLLFSLFNCTCCSGFGKLKTLARLENHLIYGIAIAETNFLEKTVPAVSIFYFRTSSSLFYFSSRSATERLYQLHSQLMILHQLGNLNAPCMHI